MNTYTSDNLCFLPPRQILPPHDAEDLDLRDSLIASFYCDGWMGRPLLVIAIENDLYQALTGSHRHAAACAVDLPLIPCRVVDTARFVAAGCRMRSWLGGGYIGHDEFGCALTEEFEWIELLHRLGNTQAAELLSQECVAIAVAA